MSSTNTFTKRQWIAEQARKHPERVFTTLHGCIDLDWMQEAYRLTRKDGALGVDGVTAADYESTTGRPCRSVAEKSGASLPTRRSPIRSEAASPRRCSPTLTS